MKTYQFSLITTTLNPHEKFCFKTQISERKLKKKNLKGRIALIGNRRAHDKKRGQIKCVNQAETRPLLDGNAFARVLIAETEVDGRGLSPF